MRRPTTMGAGPRSLAIREGAGRLKGAPTVQCPRCHTQNTQYATRCSVCMTPLAKTAPKPAAAPPVQTPAVPPSKGRELDLWSELEKLTQDAKPADARYACPSCGRTVPADAKECDCGAVFDVVLGYECPVCNRHVAADAVRCACGAQFAE